MLKFRNKSGQPNPSRLDGEHLSFLTGQLGFSGDRINRRTIERVLSSLSSRPLSTRQIEAALIAATTVGETYFMRHRQHFRWIASHWLPQWRKSNQRPGATIRVLSAGCASGEEAYSVAAVLHRNLRHTEIDFEVVGCDVNDEFLHRAEACSYRLWSLRGLDLEEERDWLVIDDGGVVSVTSEIREKVRFVQHNLLAPLSPVAGPRGIFDLILCRNVLIYFHQDAIEVTYANLADVLDPSGTLVVGPSDPSPDGSTPLQCEWEEGVRVFRYTDRADESEQLGAQQYRSLSFLEETSHAVVTTDDEAREPQPRSTETPPGACLIARSLSRLSDTRLAYDFLDQHLSEHPLDVEAHVLAALYAAELDNLDSAFELGRRAVFLAPEAPYVVFVLSDICARSDRRGLEKRYARWTSDLLEARSDDELLEYSDGTTVGQLKEVLHDHHR